MSRLQRGALLGLPLLVLLGCGGSTDVRSVPPPNAGDTGNYTTDNMPTFDPAKGIVPLPNILATAAQPAFNLATEKPTATAPLDPLKSLRYVNTIEMAGKHAVAGINAPIFMEFTRAIDPATLPAGFKIYEITPDSNGLTEMNPLTFTDITALFTFKALGANATYEGTNQVLAFPNLPLKPGTRYIYVVTSALKDATTHLGVGRPLAFGFASQATPLVDGSGKSTVPAFLSDANAAALEGIRGNVLAAPGGPIVLSGYGKTVDDLLAAGKALDRNDVKVIGRFITTGAMATYTDPATPSTLKPIDALLKAFATAGAPGNPWGASSKNWSNAVSVTTVETADNFYTTSFSGGAYAGVPHTHIGKVVTGSFSSADLAVDPFQALAVNDLAGTDATTMASASDSTYNVAPVGGAVAYGMLVQRRMTVSTVPNTLVGFYNVPRTVNFTYFEPAGVAGPSVPTVIFAHGIGGQRQHALFMADAACAQGKAVIAIDLAMHGDLSRPGLAGLATDVINPGPPAVLRGQAWTQDFMSLSSPLTGRTNIQQSAFHLFRLEYLMRMGAMAGALGAQGVVYPTPGATGNIQFAGQSLGSIVGAYYLAGTTSLNGSGVYDAPSIGASMKGLLNVPGSRIAYLLNGSTAYGPAVNGGLKAAIDALLAAGGIPSTSPAYPAAFHRTFQSTLHLIQSVVDPSDPATMGHPALAGTAGVSRFAGRLLIQEAVNDDHIPNVTTRYFANSFAGWGAVGYDFAPGFKQITYTGGRLPAQFMTKVGAPALGPTDSTPAEGYFQFDQAGTTHDLLLDWSHPLNAALAQKQMAYWLGAGGSSVVVDPTDANIP
ncbi:MAG TPA: hypothetical protein VJ570_08140 [Holophagaceae bacterium]|nr:hypothetical protein [Holophagaceae bacterium]